MIRALMDGRKTQTRRIIKMNGRLPEYGGPSGCQDDPSLWGWEDAEHGDWITLRREAGQRMGWLDWRGAYAPGDRLWVREALDKVSEPGAVFYRADYEAEFGVNSKGLGWRPSIHMPRWASRLTLTVTDVRVQRLQDISDADAVAEGCVWYDRLEGFTPCPWPNDGRFFGSAAVASFASLWNSIHGLEAWDANPWVVALTFTVCKGNIDEVAK